MAKRRGQFKKGGGRQGVRTVIRYRERAAAKPKKRRRNFKQRSRTGNYVAGAVGSVVAGASLGALANEAGLLYGVPAQDKTGISVVGWVGLGLLGFGVLFAKKPIAQVLTIGVGGGLITTEVVRQIDNELYDFYAAFGDAPPILSDATPPNRSQLPDISEADEEKARRGLRVRIQERRDRT